MRLCKHSEPATCTVCGGEGMARPLDSWSWFLRHVDPSVCAANLRRRREELERREQAIADANVAKQTQPDIEAKQPLGSDKE